MNLLIESHCLSSDFLKGLVSSMAEIILQMVAKTSLQGLSIKHPKYRAPPADLFH